RLPARRGPVGAMSLVRRALCNELCHGTAQRLGVSDLRIGTLRRTALQQAMLPTLWRTGAGRGGGVSAPAVDRQLRDWSWRRSAWGEICVFGGVQNSTRTPITITSMPCVGSP